MPDANDNLDSGTFTTPKWNSDGFMEASISSATPVSVPEPCSLRFNGQPLVAYSIVDSMRAAGFKRKEK